MIVLSVMILPVSAQDEENSKFEELLNMPLEDLLSIKLRKMTILDVHHVHPKGEWMISHKYHLMSMGTLLEGTSNINDEAVFEKEYMSSPQNMTMTMQMIGIMYGVSERLTLMAMGNYLNKTMISKSRMVMNGMVIDSEFETASKGLGDFSLSGIWSLFKHDDKMATFNFGVNLPTGSIDLRDLTKMGTNMKLAYPMQLGSGTIDPFIGLTFFKIQDNRLSYGLNSECIWRILGKNKNGYSIPSQSKYLSWMSYLINYYMSTTLRIEANIMGGYNGEDKEINPMMSPVADVHNLGEERVDVGFGINFHSTLGVFNEVRMTIEYKMPIYRNAHGPQLSKDYDIYTGLAFTF